VIAGRHRALLAAVVALALIVPAGAAAAASPAPAISFRGLGGTPGSVPLDPNLAVSATRVVQVTNDGFAIFNHHGTLLASGSLGSLWAAGGGACSTGDGDPIVVYDRVADRFVISQMAERGGYYACLAVSNPGSPEVAGFTGWQFLLDGSVFQDYPKLAVWGDSYYLTTIRFLTDGNGDPVTADGTEVFAFDRAALLSASPDPRAVRTVLRSQPNPILAATVADGGPDPTVPEYLLASAGPSQLEIWRASVDWSAATPALALGAEPAISVAPFDPNLCNPDAICIPQPFTSVRLDAISDRLMNALPYRRFLDHTSLVANQTVDSNGHDRAGIRWYELAVPGSGPVTVRQSGTLSPDSTARWMGSIALNGAGDIALGYSASSASVAPSIRYAVHAAGDPDGTLRTEATAVAGGGAQTSRSSYPDRWGDYSGMVVDPADDCTFWYTSQFLRATDAPLSTRVIALRLPTCATTDAINSGPAAVGSPNRQHGFVRGARITASWPGATDAAGAPAGYAAIVDRSPFTVPAPVDRGRATTRTWSVTDGTWWVHVRAHFVDGGWSGTATTGPFIVKRRCTIGGTDRNDVLVGTSAHDVICGFGGNDRITAGAGDTVYGGSGNDTITSAKGRARLNGDSGNDTFRTVNGSRDVIDGGSGHNTATIDRYDAVRRIAVLRRR
jgi:hypothetical protein